MQLHYAFHLIYGINTSSSSAIHITCTSSDETVFPFYFTIHERASWSISILVDVKWSFLLGLDA